MRDITTLLKGNSQSILPLIDPEKEPFMVDFDRIILKLSSLGIKQFLVGGSSNITSIDCQRSIDRIKSLIPDNQGIIQFPGAPHHIAPNADAILFLSMLSSESIDNIIINQLTATEKIHQLEKDNLDNNTESPQIIPTAYILVDGERKTTVIQVSKVDPLPQDAGNKALQYALLAKNMGFKVVYFDTGSNPNKHASFDMVSAVCSDVTLKGSDIMVFVGGGVVNRDQLNKMRSAGADKVVIGTFFEGNPTDMEIEDLLL